jgi:hypothetical protein
MSGIEPFGSKSPNVVTFVYFYPVLYKINPPIKVSDLTTPLLSG